jgi:myosin tail region-interacting protein MTI1
MAKLGGIKFGAPPTPTSRVQPSILAQPAEDTEGSTAGHGQSAPDGEEEEDEQARRQRIAAKLAGMGGMRFGMLPIQPGMGVVSPPPPPPIPTRLEEEATPRSPPRTIPPPRQPTARYSESDQEYEHPNSSDDGVQVEAEESELEEVHHEDLEDEYGVEDVEEDQWGAPPPPPPPRSTRPPVPSSRPPPIPPIGRRPSLEVSLSSGRTGSFDTITSVPRPPARQVTSDFVMVEAEEALLAPPAQSSRGPQPLPSVPPSLEPSDLAGTGYWELPSIPSGSLELHDSGVASDLSGSMWSEDSITYVPAVPPPPRPASVPPPPMMGQPRAPAAAAVTARMTADELRAVWYRVGAHVAEAAAGLFERSKRTLVGTGSYEGFIAEALAQVPNASAPHGPGEYGFLIYAQTGAQVHTRLTDIMPGDVVVLGGARLKGHKGLHTYSMSVGEASPCMGIVSDFDAKKLKLKALQANQRVGQAVRNLHRRCVAIPC